MILMTVCRVIDQELREFQHSVVLKICLVCQILDNMFFDGETYLYQIIKPVTLSSIRLGGPDNIIYKSDLEKSLPKHTVKFKIRKGA